jgi:P27 family predicted phage terminase small subunit
MGYRGPTPKPSVIEIAEGRPGKRPINEREPKYAAIMPECPAHLDERAKRHWNSLAPLLDGSQVLTEADGIALANLCMDCSILEQAQESFIKTGLLTKNATTGHIHANPLLNVIAVTTDRVTRGLREFGMTPASRSRIQAGLGSGSDPMEDSLCG